MKTPPRLGSPEVRRDRNLHHCPRIHGHTRPETARKTIIDPRGRIIYGGAVQAIPSINLDR